jgi:hypothetical protein
MSQVNPVSVKKPRENILDSFFTYFFIYLFTNRMRAVSNQLEEAEYEQVLQTRLR